MDVLVGAFLILSMMMVVYLGPEIVVRVSGTPRASRKKLHRVVARSRWPNRVDWTDSDR